VTADRWHYLDHAASTPMRPAALEAMVPVLRDEHGNPSGSHALARRARDLLDEARSELASVLGCAAGEVAFTGGGTEADDLAVRGVLGASGGTVVCSALEHPAVLRAVQRAGGRIAPVLASGVVDLDALAGLLDESVSLVSVMLVNNEVGVVQPLHDVASLVREQAPAAKLHTDAAQALTWLDLRTAAAPADLVTVVAHKCGGPRGVGALVVRDGVAVEAQHLGGGQERGRRSGTQDVAGAVAFAAAAVEADRGRAGLWARALRWRGQLESVAKASGGVVVPPEGAPVVPGIVTACFPEVASEALLYVLEHDHRVLGSAGSSCSSGAQEPSHVLAAMGIGRDLAQGAVRLSTGWSTEQADIDAVVGAVPAAVAVLRAHARDGAPA